MEGIRAILNSSIKKLAKNTIFSVTFVKKDGTIRHMQCRTGVSKYLNPNSKGLSDKQKEAKKIYNHLPVSDMQIVNKLKAEGVTDPILIGKKSYKTVPCDRVLELKAKGLHLKRETVHDEEWQLIDNNI